MPSSPRGIVVAIVVGVLSGSEVGLIALLKEMRLESLEMLLTFSGACYGALRVDGGSLRC
jgi:hypothetical protein